MNGTEQAIFAAAFAVELGKRMDASVIEDERSAELAIAFAHAAVALYREQRKDTDP